MAAAPLDFGSFFTNMYNTAVQAMSSSSSALIPDGTNLAATLLVMALGITVLMWALSGDAVTAVVDSFSTIARYSIVVFMITGWMGTVGGFFQGNANDLAQKISGTIGSGGTTLGTTVNTILVGAGALLASNSAANECPTTTTDTNSVSAGTQDPLGVGGGTSSTQTQFTTCNRKTSAGNQQPSWADMLVNFPMVLITWLLRLVAMLFMALLLAAYITVVFMGDIMFGLGMTLGPVLVPWLIWKRTEWIFDGWLKFMISGMLTKVVAAFMVTANTGVILAVKNTAANVGVSSPDEMLAVDETVALLLCVSCAIGAFLMWQVPQLASALISGGSFSAAGFGKGTATRGMREASKVPNAAFVSAVKKAWGKSE